MRALLVLLAITAPATADSDDGERSLPLETPVEAWRRPGFRATLAMPYGEVVGLRGAPSATALGPLLRAGLRLDDEWSIVASFQYLVAQPSTMQALGGMRFAGTIDPTWHLSDMASIALGFGFGGVVEAGRMRPPSAPGPGEIETSYTFPDATTPIESCSGVGATGLVRGEWSYVLSSRIAATVAAEVFGQWTGCVGDTGRVEPDTGEAIVRRQWWPHVGGTVAIGVSFR